VRMRQICFGLVLALGLPGLQAGAATLQVFGGPVGGGCNNFICYSGPPTSGTLRTTSGEAFMTYAASVDQNGMYASFGLQGFNSNRGNLDLRSTDRFTVGQIGPGGATTVDITARLRVSGQFGARDGGPGGDILGGLANASAQFTAPRNVPGVTILDESGIFERVLIDLLDDEINVAPMIGVQLAPQMTLRVEVGRAFDLQKILSLSMNFASRTDEATGGASFGRSALISFDLPEGYFITSQRGYSQGVPVDPTDPTDPSVIPLPAGGVLLLSAFGLMGWASRRRRHTLGA
jgi:hypothetical protein